MKFLIPASATDTGQVICTTDTNLAANLIEQGFYRAATREEAMESKQLSDWIPKGARTAGK